MVGPTGKVVGIDHIQNLVDWSENNLRKNHGNLIDSGQIKLVVGDGRLGYDQGGPYHAIHVGAAAAELPQHVRLHSALKLEKKCSFKSTKTHYLHFQKWQKINFCTRKKSENCIFGSFKLFSCAKIDFLPFLK